jgi:hypothetical protein
MRSRAQQYRQLARDFHFMARSLPHGQNRSTLLGMAEECDRLADQCERLADHQEEGADRLIGEPEPSPNLAEEERSYTDAEIH